MVIVDSDYAEAHGLTPLAKIVVVGVDRAAQPRDTGLGPIFAIPKALDRAGLTIADVDLAEINEAFASVPVAACRAARPRRGDHQRQRLRLLARSPGRRAPAPA